MSICHLNSISRTFLLVVRQGFGTASALRKGGLLPAVEQACAVPPSRGVILSGSINHDA